MENLQPVTNVDELPDGFSSVDPNATTAAASGGGGEPNREEQTQAILVQALTPDALSRLRRIKLVKEKNVLALEKTIVSMAMTGKLPGPITEGKLIEMLERISMKSDREHNGKISIQRKKCAFDSDDDDNDDDL